MWKVQPHPSPRRCFSGAGFASGDARTELAGSEARTQKSVLLTPFPMVPLLTAASLAGRGWNGQISQTPRTGKGSPPGQLPPD